MKSKLKVAAIQLTSTPDVSSNLAKATEAVEYAAGQGADLIALPENFGLLGDNDDKLHAAQPVEDGPHTAPLRTLAQKYRTYVLAGSIPEAGPDAKHTYNTSVLIGPAGETVASYRKIHLFDVAMGEATLTESEHVAAGESPVVANVHGWTVGLSVCYDLRFPELYRQLVDRGAEILTIPAAFTLHTGKDHWEPLIRARAIENLAYVVAPAQFGRNTPRRATWGKSMIVDPWGTVLATAPERESVVMVVLDRQAQLDVRKTLPALDNRRLR